MKWFAWSKKDFPCSFVWDLSQGSQSYAIFWTYSDRYDNALLVMFSERTKGEISKPCESHCGSKIMLLEDPSCRQVLTILLHEKVQTASSQWSGDGVQKVYKIRKDMPIILLYLFKPISNHAFHQFMEAGGWSKRKRGLPFLIGTLSDMSLFDFVFVILSV